VLSCKFLTARHDPAAKTIMSTVILTGLPVSCVKDGTIVDGQTCTVEHVNSAAGVGATCESEHSDAFSRVSDGQVMCR
jgi:hypothetical protein